MMKLIDYSLPEFVFLDGNSHDGNTLELRTVIQHVRSYTIIEAISMDEFFELDLKTYTRDFEYQNKSGLVEKHTLALHFTLSDESLLPEIFDKTEAWYKEYLKWEDKNISEDQRANLN